MRRTITPSAQRVDASKWGVFLTRYDNNHDNLASRASCKLREPVFRRLIQLQFNSIQFICIAQFHKLQICLGVLYNLYT